MLTALAFLKRTWIEVTFAHLWYIEGDFSHPGFDRFWFVAIGLILSFRCTLVRCGSEILLAPCLHGGIDHDADQFRELVKAMGSNLL